MTRHILGLRISRRAIGAAVLSSDALTLHDGRHLTSSTERAVVAATRYLHRLLEQSHPSAIVCDVSSDDDATTSGQLLAALRAYLASRGLKPLLVTKADVCRAYGLDPVPTRDGVRQIAEEFWPELGRIMGRVRPYVADAAAAALFAESVLALSRAP